MGREAGFVFKSEDLYFISEELRCSCLGFCDLIKQLWRLKPLYAFGTVPLKVAPLRVPWRALPSQLAPRLPARWPMSSHCLPSSPPASSVELVPDFPSSREVWKPLLDPAMPLALCPSHYETRMYGHAQAIAIFWVDSRSWPFPQETPAIICQGLSLPMLSAVRRTIRVIWVS